MCSEGPAAAHAKAGPTEIVWMKSKEINQASPPTHYISICHYLSIYLSIDRSIIDRSIDRVSLVGAAKSTHVDGHVPGIEEAGHVLGVGFELRTSPSAS